MSSSPGVLSLPPHLSMTSTESPMPELLSLKDRRKLFGKEIEDQHKEPMPTSWERLEDV